MPVMYKPTKFAFYTEGEPLTEPEHKNSCDINKMIKNAHRGLPVRGGYTPRYGYDDTTLDGVRFRIEKAQLEDDLKQSSKNEFTEKEFELIPSSIREKFNFKVKKDDPKPELPVNDDKTTIQGSSGQGSTHTPPQGNRATTARLGGHSAD